MLGIFSLFSQLFPTSSSTVSVVCYWIIVLWRRDSISLSLLSLWSSCVHVMLSYSLTHWVPLSWSADRLQPLCSLVEFCFIRTFCVCICTCMHVHVSTMGVELRGWATCLWPWPPMLLSVGRIANTTEMAMVSRWDTSTHVHNKHVQTAHNILLEYSSLFVKKWAQKLL